MGQENSKLAAPALAAVAVVTLQVRARRRHAARKGVLKEEDDKEEIQDSAAATQADDEESSDLTVDECHDETPQHDMMRSEHAACQLICLAFRRLKKKRALAADASTWDVSTAAASAANALGRGTAAAAVLESTTDDVADDHPPPLDPLPPTLSTAQEELPLLPPPKTMAKTEPSENVTATMADTTTPPLATEVKQRMHQRIAEIAQHFEAVPTPRHLPFGSPPLSAPRPHRLPLSALVNKSGSQVDVAQVAIAM